MLVSYDGFIFFLIFNIYQERIFVIVDARSFSRLKLPIKKNDIFENSLKKISTFHAKLITFFRRLEKKL